jgi:coenzyme F420-0:L-glutamate ligase / coenzyme F420-1:gamma-L-glutamate ligase
VEIIAVEGLPEVDPGIDLPGLLTDHFKAASDSLLDGDIVVVTSKIVSKAEARFVDLGTVTPSPEACLLAEEVCKDPALVELVLRESAAIVRKARHVLITRHRLGHVMANAGIDASNVGSGTGDQVLLLPQNPDASAQAIRDAITRQLDRDVAVIVSDSFGRPWRLGTTNVAVGVAGMPALIDQRGAVDRDGRVLQMTLIAVADSIAGAAGLMMGEADEGLPVAIVRGAAVQGLPQTSSALIRPASEDLFQ